MAVIEAKNLVKHFKVLKRREGLGGAFKDLFSRNYGTVKAVDGIDMSIEKGEIVGFIGPNGAGKSTTIKMLIGVLQASGGTVKVSGFDPFTQRRQYVRNIGVVLGQRTQLWWDLPVIESFKLLREIYRVDRATYERNLGLFNELLDLKELYMKPVRTLSLGQRTLCDIAASFLHEPAVIFLDEPTIGLDIDVRQKVRTIIRELNAIKRTTILLTSHDVGDIEELAQRIMLIDKGKLLYDGETERFLSIFGSYRTLRLDARGIPEEARSGIAHTLDAAFPAAGGFAVKVQETGWIDVVVDEDKAALLEVLSLLMRSYKVSDIKVEEIEMADVIQKVYQGALA
jgi:ABC-type uncharacterized transport system ATPase subunit